MTIEHKHRNLEYLHTLIEQDHIAMLTTRTKQGYLRSRPMATADVSERGEIFFFTMMDAELADELTDNDFVNLSYTRSDQSDFVSVSGVAQLEKNESQIHSHWKEKFKKWVPEGVDNPNLALLKITPLAAEHWGSSAAKGFTQLFSSSQSRAEHVHEYLD